MRICSHVPTTLYVEDLLATIFVGLNLALVALALLPEGPLQFLPEFRESFTRGRDGSCRHEEGVNPASKCIKQKTTPGKSPGVLVVQEKADGQLFAAAIGI